jgi:type IV pilus assembly protein PilM
VSVFTRDSSIGANLITEALQKEYSISFEDAERLKRGESLEKVTPEEAQVIITRVFADIINEVSRSLGYFKSSTSQQEIYELILSGGCALIHDFPRLLSEKIGIEVRKAEPFRNIQIPKQFDRSFIEEIAPITAVAVGLAIRRPGDR